MPDLCKGTDEFLGQLGQLGQFASRLPCHTVIHGVTPAESPDLGRPGASSSDEEAVHLGKIWQVETVFSGLFSNFNDFLNM